ncbi:bud polarity/site selection protein (BUD family), putative [Candida dubliniensis CD36]|uniref:Bud polarity/site selection protein (BUD family), putative n=1 Tax=Candida dubliniensis (strain CD36 / ATCC MYA-646 / CBS 7987 / NCPF 3949 / NRRL Y-17841) TaxID=573826 RepID=B9W8J2_CANDC|nr:bud polarity/site selection protein (BUD family), putative [Candida dubliniensis CD36]CAX45064.1 bud polarity/site selection protein (BUD family), putative [Candida dubliniensis CD36]
MSSNNSRLTPDRTSVSSSTNNASHNSSGKRRSLNTIESSVTRLLVSTKHLLESLTQWARKEADDKFVSDAYVKLGNDFRAAIRAFSNNGIDISDIGNVPQALRIILEAALSEAPSQENLDRFLPSIRNIIVTLLQTLKTKQAKAKAISQEKSTREELPTENQRPSSLGVEGQQQRTTDKDSSVERSDALSQLQKGDVLQRRASKRFSAYQYAKLTNFNNPTTSVPKIKPVESPEVRHSKIMETEEPNVSSSKREESIQEDGDTEEYVLLRINAKTKKANVSLPVTFASLRLLFVEKFAYSPGAGNFPDIYIQDPRSGVSYELEEHLLPDVKSGTLLCLNETDDQNKSINELNLRLDDLTKKIDTMGSTIIAQVKDSVASVEIPVPTVAAPTVATKSGNAHEENKIGRKDITNIEREFRAIKQLHNSSSESFKETISNITEQLRKFQEIGLEVSQNSNRAYMESCNSKLSDDSDSLITKVDDLQDIMEEMRKDVAQRGVRVSDKQLKHILKDINLAKKSLHDMTLYISKERPVWKKIWEAELDKVCEEQQFLNLQDDLIQDLQDDIKKIEETYNLIEQCSIEQIKGASSKRNKIVANLYIPEPGESLHDLKDAVLNDIAGLTPNHESRLEAIERAEKLREKERDMMKLTKFQEELGDFVEDRKLKKSGGIEELEKQRQLKDIENLKSSFGGI